MTIMAKVEPVSNQKPGISGSAYGVQGPNYLGHHLLLSQEFYQGTGLEVEQQGLELAPQWGAGFAE